MPELPEVEGYRRYFEATSLQQVITGLETENEGRMLPGGRAALAEAVVGRKFTGSQRIGKYMFALLDEGPVLMIHFGMTGHLKYQQQDSPPPRFARVRFQFENGYELSVVSMRKFSRLKLAGSVAEHQTAHKLGPDALEVSEAAFVESLRGRAAYLKSALLGQQHFAGVGNWIADEMLYQTQLSPEVRCHELADDNLQALYAAMQDILQMAIDHRARYEEFPAKYMVNERWQAGNCPRCQTGLVRIVIGGRGTFFCPCCQGEATGT